jgi:D-sedoheptulose 7-phosphate isomerase
MLNEYLEKTKLCIDSIKIHEQLIEKVVELCVNSIKDGNKIIFCGNGGSAADSQHLAAEFMGRFLIDRNPLPAISLTVDTSALTAIGNDYGYEKIFERQLKGIGKKGDILFGLSTSGNSVNIINAMNAASEIGITNISMTGNGGGEMGVLADYLINVESDETNHIQEAQIVLGHFICKLVEERLFL